MAKPEWGAKRICHNCGTRYYDMRRDPIVCPSCGAEFDPEAFLKSRRSRVVATEEPARPKKAKPEVVEEDEETVDEAVEDEAELEDPDLETRRSSPTWAATTGRDEEKSIKAGSDDRGRQRASPREDDEAFWRTPGNWARRRRLE